jgi:FkbM family methyltransferase
MLRRPLRYFLRREVRRRPALSVARRLRYEVDRTRGPSSLGRERIVRFGDDLRIHVRLSDTIERTIFLFGVYEFLATQAFLSLLEPGATFVDGGAHVGHYTLLGAERVGHSGRVLAFEPDPRNRERLVRNVELNRLANVSVLPYALFDHESRLPFAAAAGGDTGVGGIALEGAMEVDAVRLDYFLERESVERVDVLKLDVEGVEAQALAGAAKTLELDRPVVLFEVNGITSDEGRVTAPAIDVLRDHGYRLHAIQPQRGRTPFTLKELAAGEDPRPYAERWYALNLVAIHPDDRRSRHVTAP